MNEKVLKILEYDRIIEKLKDRASSQPGKELAEKLVPSADFDEVKRLQKETTDAVNCILRKGSPPLGGISDIRPYIQRAGAGGMLNPGELLKIADVLRASRNLKNYISQDRMELEETNAVYILCSSLGTNRTLEDRLNQAIENEEELSDYASPALAAIRRDIRRMQDAVRDKLNSIIRSAQNRKIMQDAVVTLRGDRYVIPVKAEYRSQFPGLVHDVSQSGATIFIEPMAVVELNNEIRQLRSKEERETERILMELTGEVANIAEMLRENVRILAYIEIGRAHV